VSPNPPASVDAIERLKREIDRLTREQNRMLELAIYVGMTADEEKEFDKLHSRILEYQLDLKMLEARHHF